MQTSINLRLVWLVFLGALSAFLSYGLACVMPFAALAAISALNLRPRDALAATFIGWAANQAIGFSLLHYPTDPMTLAWGVALGLSAMAAVYGALMMVANFGRVSLTAHLLAFGVALVAQQGVVALSNAVLTSHPDALSLATFLQVLQYNVVGFGFLLLAQFLGHSLNLTRAPLLATGRN